VAEWHPRFTVYYLLAIASHEPRANSPGGAKKFDYPAPIRHEARADTRRSCTSGLTGEDRYSTTRAGVREPEKLTLAGALDEYSNLRVDFAYRVIWHCGVGETTP
jgi:hypothetical protein